MKYKFYVVLASAIVLLATVPSFADYKIKQRMQMSGQTIETTVLVKGSRKRSESSGIMGMGAGVSTIEQCDLKRNVQVSDGKKLYFVQPFDNSAAAENANQPDIQNSQSKTEKGGTVTMTYTITDTGERKQMFGLTARRLKTVMTMQASPDACSKNDMRMETDGWYVDLPQFSCPVQGGSNPVLGGISGGGCRDRYVTKTSGSGKLGFPLMETRTMKTGSGENNPGFTQTIETVEFSNANLDAALFDVPKNYTLATSSQDLYDKPDLSRMMSGMNRDNDSSPSTKSAASSTVMKSATTKKVGAIRIGVLAPSNKTNENLSAENLRAFLIEKLSSGNVEAVSINSEADAKAMSCDFVLTTDVSKLKQPAISKLGGVFGKVTNTDASAIQKFEAQVDFKLTNSGGQVILQSKTVQKSEGSAETVTEAALAQQAQQVLSKAKN